MKRRKELKRAPDEISNMLEIHYQSLEDDKPTEQAVNDFNRPAYHIDPFGYLQKKREENKR